MLMMQFNDDSWKIWYIKKISSHMLYVKQRYIIIIILIYGRTKKTYFGTWTDGFLGFGLGVLIII
jgi:hypothetical protein